MYTKNERVHGRGRGTRDAGPCREANRPQPRTSTGGEKGGNDDASSSSATGSGFSFSASKSGGMNLEKSSAAAIAAEEIKAKAEAEVTRNMSWVNKDKSGGVVHATHSTVTIRLQSAGVSSRTTRRQFMSLGTYTPRVRVVANNEELTREEKFRASSPRRTPPQKLRAD